MRSRHILWLLGLPLSRTGLTIVLASIENWACSMESCSGEQAAQFLAIRANTAHLPMLHSGNSLKATKASTMHAMMTSMFSLGAEEPLRIVSSL